MTTPSQPRRIVVSGREIDNYGGAMNRWNSFWDRLWDGIAKWLDVREKKAMLRANKCPACEDRRRKFICSVCKGVTERPFTPEGRVIIRDRYLAATGINLFE